jgi:cysteine dioxygenase
LCWSPEKESAIHDHPADGCWMKVLQGEAQECRYRKVGDGTLVCYQDVTVQKDDVVFIEDAQGYHKIGNPGRQPAVTLHLYSPPIQRCQTWASETDSPHEARMWNYSEYGRKL